MGRETTAKMGAELGTPWGEGGIKSGIAHVRCSAPPRIEQTIPFNRSSPVRYGAWCVGARTWYCRGRENYATRKATIISGVLHGYQAYEGLVG